VTLRRRKTFSGASPHQRAWPKYISSELAMTASLLASDVTAGDHRRRRAPRRSREALIRRDWRSKRVGGRKETSDVAGAAYVQYSMGVRPVKSGPRRDRLNPSPRSPEPLALWICDGTH